MIYFSFRDFPCLGVGKDKLQRGCRRYVYVRQTKNSFPCFLIDAHSLLASKRGKEASEHRHT